MGAKQGNDKKHVTLGLGSLTVPVGTVLTEPLSVGRSGRQWHLQVQARRVASGKDSPSGIAIKRFVDDEAVVVGKTCEFLRENAPALYNEIYSHLRKLRPVDPNTPWSEESIVKRRLARIRMVPTPQGERETIGSLTEIKERGRQAPFTFRVPEIDEGHWAYSVHHNPGNYTTRRSGDPQALSDEELTSDIQSIRSYLKEYKKLSEDVSGRNVWGATYEAAFRDPYYTCMEICVGEAHLPSHFLSLVHYGIGLHFMYEQTLEWEKRQNPKSVSPELIDALKEGFRTLARLYREDFCV